VLSLGQTPRWNSTVDVGGRLLRKLLTNAPAQVSENVVSMQLQLGIDVGNDDVIDDGSSARGGGLAESAQSAAAERNQRTAGGGRTRALHQIRRCACLVRSPQFERPDGSNRTTTPAGPFDVLPARAGNFASRLPSMPQWQLACRRPALLPLTR
jgi:hypothetical protein